MTSIPDTQAPNEYLEALGAVSLHYNTLEWLHLLLHEAISQDSAELTAYRFQKADNTLRQDLLKRLVLSRGVGPKGRKLIEDFCQGYDACTHNRNMLLHSKVERSLYNTLGGPTVLASKLSKQGTETNLTFSIEKVQQIAVEIYDWKEFGRKTVIWFLRQLYGGGPKTPLPDKPEVPAKIEGIPPDAPQARTLPSLPSTE